MNQITCYDDKFNYDLIIRENWKTEDGKINTVIVSNLAEDFVKVLNVHGIVDSNCCYLFQTAQALKSILVPRYKDSEHDKQDTIRLLEECIALLKS